MNKIALSYTAWNTVMKNWLFGFLKTLKFHEISVTDYIRHPG